MSYRHQRAGRRSQANRVSERDRRIAQAQAIAIVERELAERGMDIAALRMAMREVQERTEARWGVPPVANRCKLDLRSFTGFYSVLEGGSKRHFVRVEDAVDFVLDSVRIGYGLTAYSVLEFMEWCGKLLEQEVEYVVAS